MKWLRFLFATPALIILALFLTVGARAQLAQFSLPTPFTTTFTNSALITSNTDYVSMPSISLSIMVTNPVALITNTFNTTFTNGPFNFTIQRTFIFNAATMGTNFSTNFPAFAMPCGVYVYGQASQGPGNTNGALIQ